MVRPKIILFGDSITEESFGDGGWGAALANLFSRKADVVLRGYSGYNTRWALLAKETAFGTGGAEELAPVAVTVLLGANDACLPDRSSAFHHVPPNEYKQNLHDIISFIKKRWPTTLVVLITPPPIDEDGRLRHPYGDNLDGLPERTNEFAGSYAKACISVAGECGIPVVDLWSKMQQFPGWEKAFLSDGLHLTPSGNRIVFEEVVAALTKEGISVDTLPVDLPLFSQIDSSDPQKSFRV
ncbi:hypothetical protein MRB53_035813 [Persea americana]|uniref:Uncharacterized protein n=1 Tax=Persea americana TaxID=3435 RepID=A0ACC2K5Q5_PERAE|nr:hypothetical protein MRB53_035813 [Persea americana]